MSTTVIVEKMMLTRSRARSALAGWVPIPLRLIVGYGFIEHGFAKMSRGPDTFAAILGALGVPAPHLMTWASILTEVLGGLAVLVGGFVTVASIPMAMLLFVAIFTVHLPNGFSSVKLVSVRSPIVLLQRKGQDEKDPYGHLDGPVTGSTKPHCTCPNTVESDCAGHH